MTTPTDGVEGTQGKLFYWTRQGISLADFQKAVEDAIKRVQEAGGIEGITQIGMDLITSATQQAARDVIDAASTAQAAGGGGGGGGTIDLPIEMTDVNGLPFALGLKSDTGHHHVAGDINGLSAPVSELLAATNHAGVAAALDIAPADLVGINDVSITALTAAGATLLLRQAAFRTAIGAMSATDATLEARLVALEAIVLPTNGTFPMRGFIPTTLGTARPAGIATDGTQPLVWVFPGETDPTFMVAGDFHLEL